jgi:hypothetical protein
VLVDHMLAEALQHAFRDLGGFLSRHVLAHHDELVPAEPGQGVTRPQCLGQAVGGVLQGLVASRVAGRVVHQLEVVEVEEHDCQL